MTAGVIQLEPPNAAFIIDLGRDANLTQAITLSDAIEPLPERKTLHIPLGNMVRTWTITAYLDPATYHARRKELDDAAQDWWDEGDGSSRLIWGEESEGGADYDFDVAIISVVYSFLSQEGGTDTLKYIEVTIQLQESPPIAFDLGRLNA